MNTVRSLLMWHPTSRLASRRANTKSAPAGRYKLMALLTSVSKLNASPSARLITME